MKKNNSSQVYILFPKTGLGNMLFVWARGMVFARLNNLPYYTSSWTGIRWGTFLRREKKKRIYWRYFKETNFFIRSKLGIKYFFDKSHLEPVIQKLENPGNNRLYVFHQMNMDNDLFGTLREHQQLIKDELYKTITPTIANLINKYPAPVIGVHIRRGDFKIANPITPNEFFIEGINLIRKTAGSDLPVTIFTDADDNEIADILKLPQVHLAEKKPDIADLILLSKSKILLLSQSSTFSYWAAFLSEALVIRPMNDWQKKIRAVHENYNEILWQNTDPNSIICISDFFKKKFKKFKFSK